MIIDTHCHFDMMPHPEAYISAKEKAGGYSYWDDTFTKSLSDGATTFEIVQACKACFGIAPIVGIRK